MTAQLSARRSDTRPTHRRELGGVQPPAFDRYPTTQIRRDQSDNSSKRNHEAKGAEPESRSARSSRRHRAAESPDALRALLQIRSPLQQFRDDWAPKKAPRHSKLSGFQAAPNEHNMIDNPHYFGNLSAILEDTATSIITVHALDGERQSRGRRISVRGAAARSTRRRAAALRYSG